MGRGLIIVALIAIAIGLFSSAYIVTEADQVIITRFGEPVRGLVADAGLHFRVPFIEKIHRFEKRWLEWDGFANEIPTRDKKYIYVDTYARWRITDPLLFYQKVKNERGAQTRLDDIIDGETRNVIASYNLIEAVRASNRGFEISDELASLAQRSDLEEVKTGRPALEKEILERARKIMPDFGVELVDVRFKRINYIESVRVKAYERMIAERRRIAEQYRSEGAGRSAEILGEMERDLLEIQSGAYKAAEKLRGEADAKATKVYADAYNRDAEFYEFTRTLETWERSFASDTALVLTTDSDFLKYIKSSR